MIQWAQPEWLHALWAVPIIGGLCYVLARRRQRQLAQLLDPAVLADQWPTDQARRGRRRAWCGLGALALSILALAQPQWGERWMEVEHMGLDIMVVLDTSNSMRAEDIRPTRLERAKLGLRDLTEQLRGDRIGLIPFAGASYIYCPFTSDYSAFLMMLDDVYPGIIPRGGTAIEQALRRAINAFDDHLLADRVILLITDGEDHEGDPLRLIDEMRHRNIRLFAVGVGTPEGDLIPMTDEQGRLTFLRDREGNIVRTRLHEELLERLATRTGGMYVRATPGRFGLEEIYREGIAPLQRAELDSEMIREYEDRFVWFLGAALLLLIWEAYQDRTAPPRPRQRRRDSKAAAMAGWVAVLFWAFGPGVGRTQAADPRGLMEQGRLAYEAGEFETAARYFQEAAEAAEPTRLDPARAWFNRGNALFQQGTYEAAADAYEQALRTGDLALQQSAYFNRGIAWHASAESTKAGGELDAARRFVEQALDQYEQALTLDPRDVDAKRNHEWAADLLEEIEELIAQQPPQPEPAPDEQPDRDPDDPEDDADPDPQPDDEEGEEEPAPPDAEPDPTPEETPDPEEPAPDQFDEMTEEEAMLLLDALRDEEQETRDQMQMQLGEPEEVEKDW